ncbi:MAG TPA: glycosyltransferase family 9 protein [Pyrinomonadaceae bacterium]|jgi:lipopolysaccharide heptosyltransferase II
MKSLRENPETAAALVLGSRPSESSLKAEDEPQPLGPARWDWSTVRRVLVVRLRSIGDTVLATPALHALRRFLPGARIDILLEDWVAPVLDGFPEVDRIITVERRASAFSRARVARELRAARYDVAYNLHGGTTATLLTRGSGAGARVGYDDYQYSRLHNHAAPSPIELWGRERLHSVEQQLALLGWTGVPVTDRPRTSLAVTERAAESIEARLSAAGLNGPKPFALVHPAAAFETKRWAARNFARVIEYLHEREIDCVAVSAPNEAAVIAELGRETRLSVTAFTDLSLQEVTALAARSRLFVGNDSGIAHIAAAVGAPSVVIFGSSNTTHWRPWAHAPAALVREELHCQPCPGYTCAEFDQPECIRRVEVERVTAAIERVMSEA